MRNYALRSPDRVKISLTLSLTASATMGERLKVQVIVLLTAKAVRVSNSLRYSGVLCRHVREGEVGCLIPRL
jgi:hypothetical protein